MNQLEQLYERTMELEQVLAQPITAKNRDEVIVVINTLINEREKCMENLRPPYTEEEKQLGKQIIERNETIKKKMDELFEHIKQDMKQVKKQEKSSRSYINPYGKFQTTDGMYLDSKQ
ncbi:flagellar protein FliT [Virgibacillus sp. W0430]|uniref:flagellar protein FliT n=1 Tax=Virgibacillus sp. W0430 TaxID=3391580 RepID=UPI003F45845D